jgi:tetratricopeptide (TPR) repeat protein
MHRPFALVLFIAITCSVFAQAPAAEDSRVGITEAIGMMDSGRYDAAIAKLKAVLAEHPGHEVATYELGMAYAAKGDSAHCRTTLEALADTAGPNQVAALGMLGNCLDHLGEREKAKEVYRRGLKLAPDDAQLLFNLAVTLAQTGGLDEARALAQNNVRKNPWYTSGHLLLAKVFEMQSFRVPAAFSYMRFLALEPSTARSAEAATRLQGLMSLGVEKTKKGANITIDPSSRKEEGDYSVMEMMLSMVAASDGLEKNRGKSELEKAQDGLVTAIKIYLESEDKTPNFTSTVQRPFFNAMAQEKLLETYAGLALSTLKLKGGDAWLKKNAKDVERYLAWMRPQAAKSGIVMPAAQ